jgi:hypothetical protein
MAARGETRWLLLFSSEHLIVQVAFSDTQTMLFLFLVATSKRVLPALRCEIHSVYGRAAC